MNKYGTPKLFYFVFLKVLLMVRKLTSHIHFYEYQTPPPSKKVYEKSINLLHDN